MYNAVIYIAKCVSAAEAARLPGFEECVLNDHHYTIGEKFHPVIDVNGTLYEAVCFNCTCLPVSVALFAREIIGARCACACAAHAPPRARGEKLFTGEAKCVHTLHTSIKDSMGSIKVPLSNRLRHLAITSTARKFSHDVGRSDTSYFLLPIAVSHCAVRPSHLPSSRLPQPDSLRRTVLRHLHPTA